MKKLLFFGLILFACPFLKSEGIPVRQAPIKTVVTPVSVAISSFTFTKVPTSQTVGRMGIIVSNPWANLSPISGYYGNCTSSSAVAAVSPVWIAISSNTTNNDKYISMREDVCLWLVNMGAVGNVNLHYQEVAQ